MEMKLKNSTLYNWYNHLKSQELLEVEGCSGRPATSRTDENMDKVSAIQLKSGETTGSCTMTTVWKFLVKNQIAAIPQPTYFPYLTPCNL